MTSAGSIENYENDVVEVIVDALFVENFEKIIGDDYIDVDVEFAKYFNFLTVKKKFDFLKVIMN